jgi:thymidylate kinase
LVGGIVIEGPDGSGKTTLIDKLRRQTTINWPIVHVVQPGVPDIRQMIALIKAGPIIFDRFHLSPIVYGEVLRAGPELDEHDRWALEGMLKARGFLTVICLTSVERMCLNNRAAEQMFESVREKEIVRRLLLGYLRSAVDGFAHGVVVFDYQVQSNADLIDYILNCDLGVAPEGVLGTPSPTRWLVGDERNDDDTLLEDVPFYAPCTGHILMGGSLLTRSFKRLGWTWDTTALSNSVLGGKEVDLAGVYKRLGEPRVVIALGKVAYARLCEQGITSAGMFHPQAWRRFKSKEEERYARELEAAERACLRNDFGWLPFRTD